MAETEEERKVIDILVAYPKTEDHMRDPIHAVDKTMRWETTYTCDFVKRLLERNLIVAKTEGINRFEAPNKRSKWWWERPSSE